MQELRNALVDELDPTGVIDYAQEVALELPVQIIGGALGVPPDRGRFNAWSEAVLFVGIPNQISAIMDVSHADAGAASGVISAMFQIGGALGLAVITTLSNALVDDRLAAGDAPAQALTDGFQRWVLIAAGVVLVNVVIALLAATSERPSEEQLTEAVAA